jgi:hypothetical protein
MNPSIWVAVIAATAGLLTAAFTYAATRRRDREADWRKLKLEMYREFTTAMAGMAEGDAGDEEKMRFNIASNSLHLIGATRLFSHSIISDERLARVITIEVKIDTINCCPGCFGKSGAI